MTAGPSTEALTTATTEADEWDNGDRSLVLTGSHARGDAHPESDLDMRIVGDGPSSRLLKRRDRFLISLSAQSEDEHRSAMTDPSQCAEVVPGWRSAIVLVDPRGLAARLKSEAEEWSWERVDGREADRWVAREMTSLAEEVHTLIGNLDQGLRPAAAATFSGLATALPPVMTVRRRLLYESEKELWDRVAEEMGGRWGRLQATALGDGEFDDAASASLQLYAIAVEDCSELFDRRQRRVVTYARGLVLDRMDETS